jgi:hypothetical protein
MVMGSPDATEQRVAYMQSCNRQVLFGDSAQVGGKTNHLQSMSTILFPHVDRTKTSQTQGPGLPIRKQHLAKIHFLWFE